MLEIKNLCFSVETDNGTSEILKNLNLTIPDGKFVVITGPNGGGKSTLAKLIMGIEKPTSGKIYFNDTDITDLSITERAKLGISFAFQQPVRFKGITVRDLIALAQPVGLKYLTDAGDFFLSQTRLKYIDHNCTSPFFNKSYSCSSSWQRSCELNIITSMMDRFGTNSFLNCGYSI